MSPPLSVIVCTRNEEHRIGRLIEHVPFADEVLVLDCGSTDATVEVARAAGARVEHQDWLGFSKQKNEAARRAANDWVLSLDADEIVTEELAASITATLAAGPDPRDGFIVDRRGDFLGKVLPNPSRRANRLGMVRLYHREHSAWDEEMALHERVIVPGASRFLAGQLLHWNDLSIDDFISMFNRYATAEAAELYRAGKRTSVVEVLVRPFLRMGWLLFVRGHIRLGAHGFINAGIRGVAEFVRYAKLWERQITGGGQDGDTVEGWGRDSPSS